MPEQEREGIPRGITREEADLDFISKVSEIKALQEKSDGSIEGHIPLNRILKWKGQLTAIPATGNLDKRDRKIGIRVNNIILGNLMEELGKNPNASPEDFAELISEYYLTRIQQSKGDNGFLLKKATVTSIEQKQLYAQPEGRKGFDKAYSKFMG